MPEKREMRSQFPLNPFDFGADSNGSSRGITAFFTSSLKFVIFRNEWTLRFPQIGQLTFQSLRERFQIDRVKLRDC